LCVGRIINYQIEHILCVALSLVKRQYGCHLLGRIINYQIVSCLDFSKMTIQPSYIFSEQGLVLLLCVGWIINYQIEHILCVALSLVTWQYSCHLLGRIINYQIVNCLDLVKWQYRRHIFFLSKAWCSCFLFCLLDNYKKNSKTKMGMLICTDIASTLVEIWEDINILQWGIQANS